MVTRKQALRLAWADAAGGCVITKGMLNDFEAKLASEGYVLARYVERRKLPGAMSTESALDYAQGWNACRDYMLGDDAP